MKIAIEARALSASMGIKTYVRELLRELLAATPHHELSVLYDQDFRGQFAGATEVVVPLRHPLLLPVWLNRQIPRALRSLQPAVVHFTKAALPARYTGPSVVTIYDVIPLLLPESQSFLKRHYWPRTLHHAAAASNHILTISEASKEDIVRTLLVEPSKITVTPLAVRPEQFSPAPQEAINDWRQRAGITKPYLLFIGTLEPRKNVPLLIRAFARVAQYIPHDLVIAGRRGRSARAVAAARVASGVSDRIHLLPPLPEPDLASAYSGADLFVWPSVYEGWGLPPHEAMACGTPVVVSSGGSLPEVVGSAGEIVPFSLHELPARRFDRQFEIALAERIGNLVQHPAHLEQMAAAGIAQARRFTWAAVAAKTLAVYKRVARR